MYSTPSRFVGVGGVTGSSAVGGALATGDGVALSFVGMASVPERHDGDVAAAVAKLEPEDDLHASAAYRRRLAEQLAARVIARVTEAA